MSDVKIENLPFIFILPNYNSSQEPIIPPSVPIPEEVRLQFEKTIRDNSPFSPINLTILANQGDINATFHLGFMKYWGFRMEKDRRNGFLMIKNAADNGHSNAQFVMGGFCLKGENVPRDSQKAIEYFQMSADQNFPPALYNMGIYLSMMPGKTQDIPQAIHYFAAAARENFEPAIQKLSQFPKEMVKNYSPESVH
ncbi:MAG: sel1 repeat family protein [Deltaproteobacteria bacterium]|jgi:hypothetical protein|nr:sel1 repeat family protein [Deltaproteobacteria bacterium]